MEVILLDKEIQTEIVNFLTKKVSPYVVYLFGSKVKGTANNNSDIDIAYLSVQDIDEYENFMLAQGLAGIINNDVDLIDLNKASTLFQG
jgi:uncharacterized protein